MTNVALSLRQCPVDRDNGRSGWLEERLLINEAKTPRGTVAAQARAISRIQQLFTC